MVFHCRCFSLFDMIEYGIGAHMQSSVSTFYTAASTFSTFHTHSSENPNVVDKRSKPRVFAYDELEAATDNFSTRMKIDENVYKGVVKSLEHPFDEIQVAVKRLEGLSRFEEWEAEIAVLQVAKHPNIVKLIGYCEESPATRLLVYEYMANRSMKDQLHSNSETHLSWTMRMKVAQHVACGLAYLHEEMKIPVVLRGFNPSTILLDDQWNVKLARFGPSRTRLREHHTYPCFVGTKAYVAPEHISEQYICPCTPKSDVWSYGVFLYELITGRHPLDENRPQNDQKLLEWIKPYLGSERFHEIIDPRLGCNYQLNSVQKLSTIANKCLSKEPGSRPKMSEVLKMLNKLIDKKKNSVGIQRNSSSCLSCFKRGC